MEAINLIIENWACHPSISVEDYQKLLGQQMDPYIPTGSQNGCILMFIFSNPLSPEGTIADYFVGLLETTRRTDEMRKSEIEEKILHSLQGLLSIQLRFQSSEADYCDGSSRVKKFYFSQRMDFILMK